MAENNQKISYSKNIVKKKGIEALLFRLNLKKRKGRRVSRKELEILIEWLNPIVFGVLSERQFVEFQSFGLWSKRFRKTIFSFRLTRGAQTDVSFNYQNLKLLERQIKELGFNVGYFSISPKLNNVEWNIEPTNSKIKRLIKATPEMYNFFESLERRGNSGSNGLVIRSFLHIPQDKDDGGWPLLGESITDCLYQQLAENCEENGVRLYDLQTDFNHLTGINIVRSLVRKAATDADYAQELQELIYELNLALSYLPKEAFKVPIKISEQIKIIFKKTKFTEVPTFVLATSQEPIVTEVWENYQDELGEDKLQIVTDQSKCEAILNEHSKAERAELEEIMERIWDKRKKL